MEVRVFTSEEAFWTLKEPWTQIVQLMQDSTPFQTWEWNYYFWKSHPSELLLMAAVQEKTVYGIAPLVIRDGVIEFIGGPRFDYGLFICTGQKADVFDLFFSELNSLRSSRKLNYQLKNIPIWSSQFLLFREKAQKEPRVLCRELVSTAGIRLKEYGSFDRYRTSISASLRKKSIKPCLNADVVYSIEPYSESLWQVIERIYERRMEDRVGVSSLSWAKETVKDLNAAGLLKIGLLQYCGEYTAFIIFFSTGNTYSIWLTAFQAKDNYRFGHYIRYCLIQSAFENGIDSVDMMRGAYHYKREWGADISCNVELRSFSHLLGKTLYSFRMKLRSLLRDFVYQHKKLKSYYQKLSKMGNQR